MYAYVRVCQRAFLLLTISHFKPLDCELGGLRVPAMLMMLAGPIDLHHAHQIAAVVDLTKSKRMCT